MLCSWTRGGKARLIRQAHNLEIAGSNPAPATDLGLTGCSGGVEVHA